MDRRFAKYGHRRVIYNVWTELVRHHCRPRLELCHRRSAHGAVPVEWHHCCRESGTSVPQQVRRQREHGLQLAVPMRIFLRVDRHSNERIWGPRRCVSPPPIFFLRIWIVTICSGAEKLEGMVIDHNYINVLILFLLTYTRQVCYLI